LGHPHDVRPFFLPALLRPLVQQQLPWFSFGKKQMKKTNPISDKQDEDGYWRRVYRGGSWDGGVYEQRRSYRGPSGSSFTVGFRLVRNK
jgi:hypothetical protein